MKKHYHILAFATLLLAGCSQDDYVGETYDTSATASGESAILFSSSAPAVTRATQTGATAATTLLNSFDVLGTKYANNDTVAVFADAAYPDNGGLAGFGNDANQLYTVWYTANSANTSSTNVAGWEYVGESSTTTTGTYGSGEGTAITLNAAQTVKYWDYSASQYDFVAYKATLGGKVSNVRVGGTDVGSFKFEGTLAQLAGLYVADKRVIAPANYGETVTLTFRNSATKVRVGFYETIPGYSITSMKFYYDTSSSSTTNAYINGTFNGNSSDFNTSGTYYFTYDGTADGSKASTTTTTSDSPASYYDFGALNYTNSKLGTAVTSPTYALQESNTTTDSYQYVNPNSGTNNIAAMTLKVDFTLTSDDGNGETITVYGATATVPAAYMEWKSNYAYTYLFKISDNTNGTTGTTGDPTGLYPITFDAVVLNTEDGTQEVISEGSSNGYTINTYQANSNSTATATAEYTAGTVSATIVDASGTNKISSVLNLSSVNSLTTDVAAVYQVTGTTDNTTEGDIVDKLNGINNGLTLTAQTPTVNSSFYPSGSSSSNSTTSLDFTVTSGNKYAVVYCITPYNAGNLAVATTYSSSATYYIRQSDGGSGYKYYEATGVTSDNFVSDYYYYDSDDTGTEYYAPTEGVYAVKYITVAAGN